MKGMLTSWLGSLGVGLSTAIIGAALGLWVATRAVDWYQIPSREGGSGYFVLFQGIFGFVIGLAIGVVVSRVVVNGGGSQLKAMLLAAATHVALIAVIAGIARLRADVPPTFEGEQLLLAVEVSWPDTQAPNVVPDSVPYLTLSAMSGGTPRVSQRGPLWTDDTRRESGRVIIPGAVEIFTSRGKRLLQVNTRNNNSEIGLLLPLPSSPGAGEREWSDWMPRARDGAPSLPDGVRYRFRVVKRTEPIRIQTVGQFSIETIARRLMLNTYDVYPEMHEAEAHFVLRYRGEPVTAEIRTGDMFRPDPWKENEAPPADAPVRFTQFKAVTVIPGETPSLVVEAEQQDERYRSSHLILLRAENGGVKSVPIAPATLRRPHRLSVTPTHSPKQSERMPEGVVDFRTLAEPGLYLYHRAVLDTRTLTVQALPIERAQSGESEAEPLSLSPDEKHMARLRDTDDLGMTIEQITLATNTRRRIPVGSASTATGNWSDADQVWFDHYFAWNVDASGAYEVRKKEGVTSLPHRGTLQRSGDYREWRVTPVRESLRDAIIAELVQSMGAVAVPSDSGAFSKEVNINGDVINLGYSGDDDHVSIWVAPPANTQLVVTVSRHLDSLLATRRWDSHFISRTPDP